jgi:hypothetical protein
VRYRDRYGLAPWCPKCQRHVLCACSAGEQAIARVAAAEKAWPEYGLVAVKHADRHVVLDTLAELDGDTDRSRWAPASNCFRIV